MMDGSFDFMMDVFKDEGLATLASDIGMSLSQESSGTGSRNSGRHSLPFSFHGTETKDRDLFDRTCTVAVYIHS